MNAHTTSILVLATLMAGFAATGCQSGPPASTGAPSPQPLIGASPVATTTSAATPGTTAPEVSAAPAPSPEPSPTDDPLRFRENFDGSDIDTTRWKLFPQSGLSLVRNGQVELLNAGKAPNYPYLVTQNGIIPPKGAWFFEFVYSNLGTGAHVAYNLDYLPPDRPGAVPLTQPFMTTGYINNGIRFFFATETGSVQFTGPRAGLVGEPHRIRIEGNDEGRYRVILDTTELGTFTSQRRPQKFWIGQFPLKDTAASSWPHLSFDYIEAAPLITPDPAEPAPKPSPSAVASPAS